MGNAATHKAVHATTCRLESRCTNGNVTLCKYTMLYVEKTNIETVYSRRVLQNTQCIIKYNVNINYYCQFLNGAKQNSDSVIQNKLYLN